MKRINYIILCLMAFIIFPFNIKAVSTDYISIDESVNFLEEAGLSLIDVKFNDFSNTEYPSIGMSGIIQNNNSYEIDYKVVAEFYDSSYEILGATMIEGTLDAFEEQSYSDLSSPDVILYQGNVSDIAYYILRIDVGSSVQVNSREYYIKAYDVDIKVNENNTYDVTEKITAYYNVNKHGIIRTIPLMNNITRLDGTTSYNKTRVKKVSVDSKYKTYREGNNYVIKIGSKNKMLTGEHQYVIKYTYNIGKDPLKDIDELYFNIIGTEWDTTISGITFTITMPKDFDANKIGFSSGSKGSTDNKYIEYDVDGNIITGTYKATLDKGEGLTIRCELPEGYFKGKNPIPFYSIFVIFLSIVGAIYSFIAWLKYGKDDKVVQTVEVYPPKDLNSCEVQCLLDDKTSKKGVISLLLYLANKGYIKIEETEKKKMLSTKKGFKLTKIKEYKGNNSLEKQFFNKLFSYSKKGVNYVTEEDLKNKFYSTINSIKFKTDSKFRDKMFNSNEKYGKRLMLIIFTLIFITTVKLLYEYMGGDIWWMLGSLIPLMIGCAFVTLMISVFSFSDDDVPFWVLIIVIILIVMPIVFLMSNILSDSLMDPLYKIDVSFVTVSIVIILIFGKFLKKRTSSNTKILGRLRGFKEFLEVARKEELEKLVEENPTYFYDILPYTYALGISDKWVKKFESISIESPKWYSDTTDFNINEFSHFMSSTINSASKAMSSSPSSSSGGGGSSFSSGGSSSGGGFSGGGSGGGGGSSW